MAFALAVDALCEEVRRAGNDGHAVGQLRRSSASLAANYRAAKRARSDAEFIAKLGLVIEEADEAHYWLDYLLRSGRLAHHLGEPQLAEANELVAMFTTSVKTAKANQRQRTRAHHRLSGLPARRPK